MAKKLKTIFSEFRIPNSEFIQNPKAKKLASVFAILCVIGMFFGGYLLVVSLLFGGRLNTFWPVLSDEADYFLTVKRITQYGIVNGGGYNGYYANGEFSVAGTLNYGGHGFLGILPYIPIFLMGGTGFPMAIVSHLILMTIAFTAVYFLTNSLKKTIAVQAASLAFMPFLLYFGSFMMEVQQFALALIMAAVYYRWIITPPTRENSQLNSGSMNEMPTRPFLRMHKNRSIILSKKRDLALESALIILIFLSCVTRISNLVFFIPYVAEKSRRGNKPILRAAVMSGIILVCCYAIYYINGLFTAPYTSGFLYTLANSMSNGGITGFMRCFGYHFMRSLYDFFVPFYANPIFILMRYLLVFLFVFFTVRGFFYYDKQKEKLIPRKKKDTLSISFAAMIFGIAALVAGLYDMFEWRDFRTFAPFVLFFVVYLLISSRLKSIKAAICVMIIFSMLPHTPLMRTPYAADRWNKDPRPSPFAQELQFDENAENPWGNTVLTNLGGSTDTGVWLKSDCRFGWIIAMDEIDGSSDLRCGYILIKGDLREDFNGYELIKRAENMHLYKRMDNNERTL